ITRKEGDLLPPRRGRRVWREVHVPIEFLHRAPVDHEAHRAAGGTAALLLEESLASDERALLQGDGPIEAQFVRRIPLRVDDRLPGGCVIDLRQDQARLDPRHVQGEHARGSDVVSLALRHQGIPQRLRAFSLHPDLVIEVPSMAGARGVYYDGPGLHGRVLTRVTHCYVTWSCVM